MDAQRLSEAHPERVPDFLTVEEAARILRIGRTVAYQLAHQYEVTGGAEGLPVRRFGRQMRVPRAALEAMQGGPITLVPENAPVIDLREHAQHEPTEIVPPTPEPHASNPKPSRTRRRATADGQISLPFAG